MTASIFARALLLLTLLALALALPAAINDWSVTDVQQWLQSIGLTDYSDAFAREAIDGSVLAELSDVEIAQSLGVTKLGHKKKLRLEIDKLIGKGNEKPATTAASTPAAKASTPLSPSAAAPAKFQSPPSSPAAKPAAPKSAKKRASSGTGPSSAADFNAASEAAKKPKAKKAPKSTKPKKASTTVTSNNPYLLNSLTVSQFTQKLSESDRQQVRDLLRDGLAHHQRGQLSQARTLYERALTIDPIHARALHMLGLVVMIEDNDFVTATQLLERSIDINDDSDTHVNLGNFYWQQQHYDEAVKHWSQALEQSFLAGGVALRARYADSLYSMSLTAYNSGNTQQCQSLMTQALRLSIEAEMLHYPTQTPPAWWSSSDSDDLYQHRLELSHQIRLTMMDSWLHLGLLYEQADDLPLALECYDRGLMIEPTPIDATKPSQTQLNNVLAEIRQYKNTLLTKFTSNKQQRSGAVARADGLAIDRSQSSRHKKMVEYLSKTCHFESADWLARAIDDDSIFASPSYPFLYETDREIDSVRVRYDQALDRLLSDQSLHALWQQPQGLEWCRFRFYLAYHGRNNRQLHEKLSLVYQHLAPSLNYTAPVLAKYSNDRKIRIGFITAFITSHPVGKTIQGYIEHLDRSQYEVVVFFIPLQPNVDNDELLLKMKGWADRFVEVPVEHTTRIRSMIEEQAVDVLVFGDIGMEPTSFFLAFSRLAPVQALTFGHPDTSGLSTVDYFLSHKGFDQPAPLGQSHYTEKLVELPGVGYWHEAAAPTKFFTRADLGLDDRSLMLPAPTVVDADRELPNEGEHEWTMYLVTKSVQFYSPHFTDLIARILAKHPYAFVALLVDSGKVSRGFELHNQCQESILDWIEAKMSFYSNPANSGKSLDRYTNLTALIPPRNTVSGRVRFVDKGDHEYFMSLLKMTDVLLQPTPLDGTTTTLEGLTLSTPTVIYQSATIGGRMGASIYQHIGVTENVAVTDEQYVDIAVWLGKQRSANRALRKKVDGAKQSGKLYQDASAVQHFQQWAKDAVIAANQNRK